ncbi:unnamed protein product [Closterium sp. NIES-64]|nr:unnamed protein product [Closterium sp. NIES-64]
MPPRRSTRGKGKDRFSDDEPMEDPPYVAWMKEQKKQGKPSPSAKHMAKAKRDSAGASTSGGARRDYDDGADTDWSDAELATLAAARWNTKDDLKAMQGKQGSQYWMKLRAHIVEGDASWNRDEGQMSNEWKRLEKKYLKTKRGEGQSGGKAIKKKSWWEYVYNLKKHLAKAKAHAPDGGGAATVDVPAYAVVPGTTEHETSGPSRVYETATMAAAKLVSDAINSTNANVVCQLQDSTQTLVAVMNMVALQAGVRLQMATPYAQQAAPQTTPDLAPPVDPTDANMAFTKEVAEQPEP